MASRRTVGSRAISAIPMKSALRRTAALVVLGILLWAPVAAAQGGDGDGEDEGSNAGADQQWAEDFEAELQELLAESGIQDADPQSLIGEPGDLDLPPGELTLTGIVAVAPEPPTGSGSELAGPCQGVAISFDDQGEAIDMAVDFDDPAPPYDVYDGAQAFTADNPFEVHVNGYVAYAGRAEPAPINHTWKIRTQGLSFDSGGDDNPDAESHNAGTVNLADDLPAPAKINALFAIDGEMVADGGFHCVGSGFFRTVGGTPVLGAAGVVLMLATGLGALFNARPARTW